jgi:Type I phosphodiesterase / nucleotide pyrophosphatase
MKGDMKTSMLLIRVFGAIRGSRFRVIGGSRFRVIRGALAVIVASMALSAASAQQRPAVTHVLLVTLDGMRWQEVFGGMQSSLLTKDGGGITDPKPVAARFDGPSNEARREKLMPFFWTVIAKQGQVFGDPAHGSVARVTNGLRFSYPGYNELLTGFPDPRVDSNDRNYNPNVTVLEWLNKQPAFARRVAAFASWELLPWIVNVPRSGLPANADGGPFAKPADEHEKLLNQFSSYLPAYWAEERFDAPTAIGALQYLRVHQPRVLYVMLGETDEWAHGRRYGLYLDAAQRDDRIIRDLWDAAQAMPEYAGHTALVVTTDHGRGDTAVDWTDHGKKVPASERIWMAVLGPGVPAGGLRANVNVTQSQIAATVASLLGEDYRRAQPKAAPALDLRR